MPTQRTIPLQAQAALTDSGWHVTLLDPASEMGRQLMMCALLFLAEYSAKIDGQHVTKRHHKRHNLN